MVKGYWPGLGEGLERLRKGSRRIEGGLGESTDMQDTHKRYWTQILTGWGGGGFCT